jgi:hypothetical protein
MNKYLLGYKMSINVNSVNPTQTQNNISSSNQEIQKTNVQAAQNYGQSTNTESSTHNLYNNSSNNLLGNRLLDPTVTQQIIKNARLDKGLNERMLSLINNNSTSGIPMPPPELLDDMYKKLMGLHSNGHLKNLMRSFYRRAKRGQSTDQSFGSHNIQEEHTDLSEKEKVKRKEGQTINENTINDVIKESLTQHDTPFQRFLLLSMTVQNTKDDPQFNKAAQEALENLYKNNGVQIRASVHSLDEAFEYSKNGAEPKKITQFQDTYYELIQAQTTSQMFSIFKECATIQEFNNITNLMHTSAAKDKQGLTLPTSDPNTIHSVLSFMNIRTSIISLIISANKFLFACRKIKSGKLKSKFGGDLLTQVHPKIIL